MPSITLKFEDASVSQLLAYGDTALRVGHPEVAEMLYQRAITATSGAEKQDAQVRLGLAQRTNNRTLAHLAVLDQLQKIQPTSAFVGDGLATWLKTLPFLEDSRFMDLTARHKELLPLANWHWNLTTVLWALQQARRLDGDFVELGVFKGHTTLFAAEYLDFAAWPKRWMLYDTFDGIPDDQLDKGWANANSEMYKGTFSFEEVRDRFTAFPNIQVIKGRVPDALVGTAPEQIAFLHMDMNNATAEIAALDTLFDRIVPGGVILFDDYIWAASRAQYDAEKAWFAARGLVVLPLPTGQGVFVKGWTAQTRPR